MAHETSASRRLDINSSSTHTAKSWVQMRYEVYARPRLSENAAERLILVNPASGCKLPKMEKREMKDLPKEKIRPYLMEADKRGLLNTGLRRGELLALLWTNLDIEVKTISVTKQINRIKGKVTLGQPKTQNSIRTLAIPQQAVDLIVEEHEKHHGNLPV